MKPLWNELTENFSELTENIFFFVVTDILSIFIERCQLRV